MPHTISKIPFINQSALAFTGIGSEAYREYTFLGPTGKAIIRIDEPLQLNVSASGGHRIFDAAGCSHYIPPGWVHLTWKAKEGAPNFVR